MKRNEHSSRREMDDVIQWLHENFPLSFPRELKSIKPLQLGVMDELLDFFYRLEHRPFSKKKLRSGLNFYTTSPRYLLSQKQGEPRVNLYGEQVELVTESQAEYAREKYDKMYGQKKKKSAQVDEPSSEQSLAESSSSDEPTAE